MYGIQSWSTCEVWGEDFLLSLRTQVTGAGEKRSPTSMDAIELDRSPAAASWW